MQALSKYRNFLRASSVQPMPSGLTVTLSREKCPTSAVEGIVTSKSNSPVIIIVIDCHFLTTLLVIR